MNTLLSDLLPAARLELPFAAIDAREFYTIYLPAFGVLIALIIPLFAMWTMMQNRKMKHETIRIALEKGQPIPPGFLDSDDDVRGDGQRRHGRSGGSHNDLRAALVLFAVAGGVYFIVPFVTPLLAFIALALLISWLIERRDRAKTEKSVRDDGLSDR